MSMKNSDDTIGNRTRDFPVCSTLPQPNVPPRDPSYNYTFLIFTTFIPRLFTYSMNIFLYNNIAKALEFQCQYNCKYRMSINSFPDCKHLLQENYVEYKQEHMLKCTNVL
jgi:hypothetical protein